VGARHAGLDETMAEKVGRYEQSDLAEHQKVALRMVDAVVTDPGGISAELRAQLLDHFSPDQVIELMFDIVSWSVQTIPVALGLDVPVEAGGDAAAHHFEGQGFTVSG
jgi:hypothetical protein